MEPAVDARPKKAKKGKEPKQHKEPKPPKPPKGLVRGVVDPADFIALRFEVVDLRARLEASEQSKAIVETRLAALDAGAAVANGGIDGEVRHRIAEFEAQLSAVAAAAANATAAAQTAAQTALATRVALDKMPTAAMTAAPAGNVLAAPSGPIKSDPAVIARLDEFDRMLAELASKVVEPTPIADHGDTIESLVAQVAQLNARVAAQAELGAQLSSLRDRINEFGGTPSSMPPPPPPPAVDDGLSANVQALTYRVEVLAERIENSDTRSRQTAEQLGAVEHRITTVSTELANQLSELSRDFDVAGRSGNGHASNGHRANGSANGYASAEALAELQAAQVKLAAEQARYEIAFRQDLAALAEHVRRAR